MIALVGLGSNIGDRAQTLQEAVDRLRPLADHSTFRVSHLYETRPWGKPDQPDYLNAVCMFETKLSAEPLMDAMKQLENDLGRERTERWGPRKIDLDLLDLGGQMKTFGDPVLPHPRMARRAFVLVPLCEIAPGWIDPLTGRTAIEMLAVLDPDPTEVRLMGRFQLKEEKTIVGEAGPGLPGD